MIKLQRVAEGELVDYVYLVAVMVEAKSLRCPIIELATGQDQQAEKFNSIIEWLCQKFPREFETDWLESLEKE